MEARFPSRSLIKIACTALALALVATGLLPGTRGSAARFGPGSEAVPGQSAARLQEDANRLETFKIQAPQLRADFRTIHVYLPPDYFTSGKSYPVIYLQDGEMVFSPTSPRNVDYDEKLDALFAAGRSDGIIAVGIASSANRWDEYSPWTNEHIRSYVGGVEAVEESEGGEGDAYLDFLIDTLKPEIDRRYRTLPGRDHTAIGGFSMGGLISLYAGLSHPEIFSMVMAVSPAVWFAENGGAWLSDNRLIQYINSINVPKNVAFYMDIGTAEWDGESTGVVDAGGNPLSFPEVWVSGAQAAYEALTAQRVPQENLRLVVEEGGVHEVNSWGSRFNDAILWLLAGREHGEELPVATTILPASTPQPEATLTSSPQPVETGNGADDNGRDPWLMFYIAMLVILLSALFIVLLLWRRR